MEVGKVFYCKDCNELELVYWDNIDKLPTLIDTNCDCVLPLFYYIGKFD